MHERDHDRHLAAGAGDATDLPSTPLDDLLDLDDPREAAGDAPPSPDLVQAVADFLDDLVDATPDASPDAPPGQGNGGDSGGGETPGGTPDVDARGGLGIDITTIAGARGGLGISDPVGSVADPGHPHPTFPLTRTGTSAPPSAAAAETVCAPEERPATTAEPSG